MISVNEALEHIRSSVKPLQQEIVNLPDLVGRALTTPITADVDSPPHDKSMMDGFAVRVSDVDSNRSFEVIETIFAGEVPSQAIGPMQASRIMTGAPLPAGSDAVVMIELADFDQSASAVRFKIDSLRPEHHILRAGANFSNGQLLFPAGHRVRPSDVGLLAEVGVSEATVCKNPTVAVLPTGDELVDCKNQPGPGQIRNSNGPMLLAMLQSLGVTAVDLGIGRDSESDLQAKMQSGLENDILILSGGVSAGQKDLVPGILKSLGVEEVFHKVKVKPGKPIWFGVCQNGENQTLVFGLPGNPVSSLVGFQLFVRAALRLLAGGRIENDEMETTTLATDHQTRGDRPTYWPGQRVKSSSPTRSVLPLKWNGSSDLLALGKADGLIFFPAENHDHAAGNEVQFFPF
jgi:molybdopterin molybdotransferase